MAKHPFNPEMLALSATRGPDYNYHTSIRNSSVHMIRESFYYALELLGHSNEENTQLAARIIEHLISYQDMDPASKTYGIWPYYLEESLSEMLAPDWNWADFCGKALLQALLFYGDRLATELQEKIKASLEAAATSIMLRDVQPSYTNICIMGTYVSLVAGEILDSDILFNYGRERLRKLHEYSSYHGDFTEYNSPTYTTVAIEDLALMLAHIQDPASQRMLKELYEMAWITVAEHFHSASRQWAGPHSRAYELLQSKSFLSLLHFASDGQLFSSLKDELDIDPLWVRAGMKIPSRLISYFQEIKADRYNEKTIVKGNPELRAASFMTPSFTLGTFNHCDFWNQRRPLLAYWGNEDKAAYMRLRFMHDDYDFSSALLHTVQHRGQVIGVANLCPDHGDKHFTLDKINGEIDASYLALRFEIGGYLEDIQIHESAEVGEPIIIRSSHTAIGILIKAARFGRSEPKLVLHEQNECLCLDVVLYEGERARINLREVNEAYAAFGLIIDQNSASNEGLTSKLALIDLELNESVFGMSWLTFPTSLHIEVPAKVLPFATTMIQARGWKNYNRSEKLVVWNV